MKTLKKYFLLLGLAIIVIGYLYDFFFAPFPRGNEPIPVIINQIQQHKIAETIKRIGMVILIVGIILSLIFYKRKKQF